MKKLGRPTQYDEEKLIKQVDEYLAEHQDEHLATIKQENTSKGYTMYENKLKVKLPTIKGFARYIGVVEKTLYNWAENHPIFLQSLDKIKTEQQERLINSGLSGDYNPTIAKLILSANHGMVERKDFTSGDKPIPILGGKSNVQSDNSDKETSEIEEKD